MKRIFITGMSGTGKSSVLDELRSRGFTAIDTDYGDWCEPTGGPGSEVIWREERMHELLCAPLTSALFVSGCRSNQGKFYRYFDHRVLFSAPLAVILERIAVRTTNSYGKTARERAEIEENYRFVQPLLEKSADFNLDSSRMTIREMADFMTELASGHNAESVAALNR